MAKISITNLRHSYLASPARDEDFVLKKLSIDWHDGGAYALLGPSGCGKTTLLNIISGLLVPTEGSIIFDGIDMTRATPEQRNIAQVFQFPVIYDTMTVYDNLAFPLRNRKIPEAQIDARVQEIAAMLELSERLSTRASGLTADGKQKISLGRGLVRANVSAIMFDEPLTVIDPHLKWQLRSKLKELHHHTKRTMIYVTHDQTEALTFADQVVVMNNGEIVQQGTPVELFEKPHHTFVGHFIGSPGMNILPCTVKGGRAFIQGHEVASANAKFASDGAMEIGVRPEFVSFGKKGIDADVVKVQDIGRFRIVEARAFGHGIKILLSNNSPVPAGKVKLVFDPARTLIYANDWLVGQGQ